MSIRTPLLRAAIATALVGSAFALAHSPHTSPTAAAVSTSASAHTPLHATLLPTVSVFANADQTLAGTANRLAESATLPVTLLPTVSVDARAGDFENSRARATVNSPRAALQACLNTDRSATAVIHRCADVSQAKLADSRPPLRTQLLPR